ncbi:hypothetical protein C8J57DRAFT_1568840 [Mycena rebaudengoi]|nr:hypothetical protein C8J57DRAFT_1568840 [Mycena rebaudengoi]
MLRRNYSCMRAWSSIIVKDEMSGTLFQSSWCLQRAGSKVAGGDGDTHLILVAADPSIPTCFLSITVTASRPAAAASRPAAAASRPAAAASRPAAAAPCGTPGFHPHCFPPAATCMCGAGCGAQAIWGMGGCGVGHGAQAIWGMVSDIDGGCTVAAKISARNSSWVTSGLISSWVTSGLWAQGGCGAGHGAQAIWGMKFQLGYIRPLGAATERGKQQTDMFEMEADKCRVGHMGNGWHTEAGLNVEWDARNGRWTQRPAGVVREQRDFDVGTAFVGQLRSAVDHAIIFVLLLDSTQVKPKSTSPDVLVVEVA